MAEEKGEVASHTTEVSGRETMGERDVPFETMEHTPLASHAPGAHQGGLPFLGWLSQSPSARPREMGEQTEESVVLHFATEEGEEKEGNPA